MGDWPRLAASSAFEDDAALSSYGVQLVTGAANTKGSYGAIVASLAHAITGIYLQAQPFANAFYLADIAIGGAGSEVVVVPNIQAAPGGTAVGSMWGMFVPLSLPAGTRIAMRAQCTGASQTLRVKSNLISDSFDGIRGVSRWEDWGADTAASRGTTLTSNASANTKGSYVQLKAAIGLTTKWVMVAFDGLTAGIDYAVDVAVGGAGAEIPFFNNLFFTSQNNVLYLGPVPACIPAGSRISARLASETAGSQTVGITVHGGG